MDKLVTSAQERFWSPEAYARDQFVRRFAQQLPAGSRVLDAGAGASKYAELFGHCRYETQDSCQYEGDLVKYLRPIDYVCDITHVPLADACLDAVVCTEVLEHLVDPMAAVREFARLLRPEGQLVLTAPFLSHVHMEPFHFYAGFTSYWYRHWLPLAGFRIETLQAVGGPGRIAAYYAHAFYTEWGAAERQLHGGRRWISRAGRALAKPLVHWVLPRLLPAFDPWLGGGRIAATFLVLARRVPGSS